MSDARADIEAVEAANTALYDAVERGDIEALSRMWLGGGAETATGDGRRGRSPPGRTPRCCARTR
ncbi:nuclear transport factor 2 family protein [Streptomyces albus]|uniref:nuclear transport factor 2 family protein n=1 Tax=Streptomyces albus TaxID=1888 RepID=UPI0013B480DD|nr:nuclear transport factor 2 family protein [Streptomyces albus]